MGRSHQLHVEKSVFRVENAPSTSSPKPMAIRLKVVRSLLIPHFIYCDVLFSHLAYKPNVRMNGLFAKLYAAHNGCLRYIFGLGKFDHISHLQNKILHCSLKQYYQFRTCFFIFQLLKLKSPSYLFNKINLAASHRTSNCIIPSTSTSVYHDSLPNALKTERPR